AGHARRMPGSAGKFNGERAVRRERDWLVVGGGESGLARSRRPWRVGFRGFPAFWIEMTAEICQAAAALSNKPAQKGQSMKTTETRSAGVLECWSIDAMQRRSASLHCSTSPLLHYSLLLSLCSLLLVPLSLVAQGS